MNAFLKKKTEKTEKTEKTNNNECILLHLYNNFHLGDNIYNIHLFNKLKSYIESNNIKIIYYLRKEYIYQALEFIKSKNITLLPLEKKQGIHLWVGNDEFHSINKMNRNLKVKISYINYYVNFFNSFLNHIKIPMKISSIDYEDEELLQLYQQLDEKYKMVDVLIVNSLPFSGQLRYIENDWVTLINTFSNKYKTVITKRINNNNTKAICTLDDNLTIKKIGAISIRAKIIIAVNTGVVSAILNNYTLNNVLHYCNLDKSNHYDYPRFSNYDNVKKINISYIMNILDNYNIY